MLPGAGEIGIGLDSFAVTNTRMLRFRLFFANTSRSVSACAREVLQIIHVCSVVMCVPVQCHYVVPFVTCIFVDRKRVWRVVLAAHELTPVQVDELEIKWTATKRQ